MRSGNYAFAAKSGMAQDRGLCTAVICREAAMKKQFLILKDRPTLAVRLTRDSVCAGDDIDAPHELTVTCHSFLDPVALASHLSSGYLLTVSGFGHTWDCLLNGKLVASLTVDGIAPRVVEIDYQASNHVHFQYHSAKTREQEEQTAGWL